MAIYEPRAVPGGGWRLALPQGAAQTVTLAALDPERDHGVLRATVVILRDTTTLAKDRVALTRAAARHAFAKRVASAGTVTVPDEALVALEIACQTTATPRRRAPEAQEAEPGPDGEGPDPATPPPPRRPLGELLDALVALLTAYIVFPERLHAQVVALWIAHTHVLEGCETTPYLFVASAQRGCGKSHLLKLIARLVRRPWLVAGPSAATVYRMVDERQPTMCMDEVDTVFKAKGSESAEALRGVLNVGNDRDIKIPRCVGQQREEIKEFSPFCPKCFTGIGGLPDTVADRAIRLALQRRKKSEPIRRWRWRDIKAATRSLHAELVAWATPDVVEALRQARPPIPPALYNRAEDLWEPLLGLADLAGGTWPADARTAAVRCAGVADDDEAVGVRLLAAMRDVFTTAAVPAEDQEQLFSSDMPKGLPTIAILAALVDRQTDPWGDWWGEDVQRALEKAEKATPPVEPKCPQRPASRLAALLRPFGIQPRTIRTATGTPKGYVPTEFGDAFERYLGSLEPPLTAPDPGSETCSGPIPPSGAATPPQPLGEKDLRCGGRGPAGEEPQHRKPLGEKDCGGVAAEKGGIPPLDHNGGPPVPSPEGGPPPACPRCGRSGGSRGDGVWHCLSCGPVPCLDGDERQPGEEG